MRYHFTPVRMAIIKKSTNNRCWQGCGERKTLCTLVGNADLCSHCGRQFGVTSKKVELPYDLAISLLGLYLKKCETLICENICTLMFIAALFTIAKIWKQAKCPSVNEWIKMLWYIYTMEYYLGIKRSKSYPLRQHGWTWKVLY